MLSSKNQFGDLAYAQYLYKSVLGLLLVLSLLVGVGIACGSAAKPAAPMVSSTSHSLQLATPAAEATASAR